MTNVPLPTEFDWVRARAACSLSVIFKELHLGAENDAKAIQRVADAQVGCSVTQLMRNRFSVVRSDSGFPESVTFVLSDGAITARNDDDTVIARATVTLNDRGECKLKTDTDELEQWQFRRRALEKLFFGPRSS